MGSILRLIAALVLVSGTLALPAAAQAQGASRASGSLTAFRSDAELRRFLRQRLAPPPPPPSPPPVAMPAPVMAVPGSAADAVNSLPQSFAAESNVVVTGAARQESITNTQEANVDEGGIVKVSGDYLVVLRRGRLFTVSIAGGRLRPVAAINAFPPGVSGDNAWYDEMLLSGNMVIVVGYSYERGGTEINRFRLGADGSLRFVDAYHLKSNDYYSTRNYASRLIGNRLIFYTPLYLEWGEDPLAALPGMRKWRPGVDEDTPFRRIATASNIYIAPSMRGDRDADLDTLHSVTTCDLTAAELDCSAVGVIGPESRTFYVSGDAVYLWVSDWRNRPLRRGETDSFLYRLPLGRERPSAIATAGHPVDQFSFREDAPDGALNVLLRDYGGGDAMGNPEASGGRVALLRLPIADFGDGQRAAAADRYRRLPGPGGGDWSFRNRFVGDHVLYGTGERADERKAATVFAAPVRGGPVARIELRHEVDRIEILGRDALVVGAGSGGRLGFTAIELPAGGAPVRGDVFMLPAASEGESRSHAFFFRPDTPDGATGILGLPVARRIDSQDNRLFGSAAGMLFLRRDMRRFANAGELAAQPRGTVDDACQASCTDWYGNARPIFLRGRIFALLGYELVEGRLDEGRIDEIGRINFQPGARPPVRD